jgi:hypothetical protein
MRLQFKLGSFNIAKHGEDHFDISIWNNLNPTDKTLSFLKKEELERIRDELNMILGDGEP